MTTFSKDDVKYFADFVRIGVSEEDKEYYAAKIADLIASVENLNEVDVSGVKPMTHPIPMINVLREDTPKDILDREKMLATAEDHEDGLIKVPDIL
ncbi:MULTISPECIES: Asp-tRNA(Asn)/Glu-tRNA(Gln) amidotransferase subunit GatC [Sporosarcina]|uniref:Asp-tRNA(Asn)/Glu-tRNA(Gln) amidotransferase subunit GatC n=1 Tax=Sporosarcina TaxID=1569 RepID=UPI00129A56A7|nr:MULTISPECIES: Asp-tRNA(Asn)/Glu-tRNA(Gln) amidotransferase subunit GatC [Sporosarcina]GKV67036.1 aspartyl/glutamyl-tRNA(Asn/Gln) amidotransferase subunit C [Sporosarcina sp. NCCP-2331]GLB57366.1 aspartyl/glutamyl-tRNA(Asn/Gln) amidotransferase subunit C [Sporosarcina sp. NCCP-2378]